VGDRSTVVNKEYMQVRQDHRMGGEITLHALLPQASHSSSPKISHESLSMTLFYSSLEVKEMTQVTISEEEHG